MTVREALRYFGNLKKIPASKMEDEIMHCICLVNLDEKKDEKVKNLSGGMVRRVGIAQALLGSPSILILDEPTAGLDPEERLRMKNLIKKIKKEKLIMISTHIVDDIDFLCDYIDVMNDGNIIYSDTCENLRKRAMGKVYRIPQSMAELPEGYLVKEYEQEGTRYIRYLSAEQLAYKIMEPEVEDGYLCVLKNI